MEQMGHVAVGMSGGVDSSVAAWLLREEGLPVEGVTMRLFGDEVRGTVPLMCGQRDDAADARRVAEQLGIPHHVLELFSAFRQKVMDPFVQEYEEGRTPNPCVLCNRALKFGAMLDAGKQLGWENVATGHYVRISRDGGTGRYLLRKAAHLEKDQSYVLYGLTQDQLAHSLFPLGEMSKDEVRAIAAREGLVTAHKGESQDICFVPDGDYGAFIRRYTGREYPTGPFLDEQGRELGRHGGIIGYTVGQRRGLGVSSNHGRLYVKELRPEDNAVILSDNASLFTDTLEASDLNWIACDRLTAPTRMWAKVRYRMMEQPCTVEQTGENSVRVVFDSPQRAVTPGQSVVFYDGDTVVGGALIRRADQEKERRT